MNSVLRFLAIAVISFVTVGSSFAKEVNLYTSRPMIQTMHYIKSLRMLLASK